MKTTFFQMYLCKSDRSRRGWTQCHRSLKGSSCAMQQLHTEDNGSFFFFFFPIKHFESAEKNVLSSSARNTEEETAMSLGFYLNLMQHMG